MALFVLYALFLAVFIKTKSPTEYSVGLLNLVAEEGLEPPTQGL